ncbi:MAG: amino acid adenylation domain-containing protein, partial [bacterium]|nr:amino acid adenylation domain-containing protein [bacterium]
MIHGKRITRAIKIAAGQNIKEYEYWIEKLSGEPVKSLFPFDYKEHGNVGTGMALNAFRFDDELSGKSVKLTRGSHHTLHIVMAAALTALLWRYTANKDIIIGTPIYRQETAKTAETGGEYINTILPLRNLLSPEMSFKDLLGQVKQTVLEAVEHQAYPVELLPEKLNMPLSGEDGFPLFDVVLLVREIHDPGDSRLRSLNPNIIFSFSMGRRYVEGEVEYNCGRYRQETIDRITGHLVRFLSQAISHINRELVQIDILSEDEKRRLLLDFNDTGTQYPRDKTIAQLFEQQAARTPDRIAVADHRSYKTYMTYDQLNQTSGHSAWGLMARGVACDDIVGIMLERSMEMIIGILAILKAGGAYLPIDPDYPQDRIDFMLKDSNARLLLTNESDIFRPGSCTLHPATRNPQPATSLAYIIYTSGSTGRPKGVMVEHRNVVRLVKNTDYLDFEESLRILQTGALEFDASTFEIWGALLNGGRLYLVEKDKILVPEALKAVVRCYNITTMWLTAPLFNQLLDADVGIFHGLRHLLVGGDVLSVPHINRVRKAYPQLKVINGYGPTENTTFSTTFHIDGDYGDRVPIGRPIANSTAYILDKYHYPAPMGVAGELWVGGDGVARGYLNNPELTAKRFGPSGALSLSAPLYNTSDLARWLPDGTIDFLGRMDHQVKIRGFRIELGEIEYCLLEHETVKAAVVTAGEGQAGDKYLCAYIVLKENAEHKEIIPELRLFLSDALPDYMIPSYFVSLENIPLTANGKVDRERLPAPGTGTTVSYTAPRDEVEKKLTAIWSLVLGIPEEKIGIDDNFFDLGGHSLKSMVMLSKIHREFNVKLSLNDIFKFLVIRKLSPLIKQQGRDEFFSIEAVEKKEYYKLSPPQKRFYILGQVERESINYNIWSCFRLAEGTGLIRLENAFKHLIRRHESFRTCFIMVNDRPVQRIHDEVEFKIEYCDSIDNFIRPFDLSSAPLLRAGVVTGDILVVDMHHIVSDGISMEIFQKELIRLYSSGELPPLRIQYKDYTEWQVNKDRQREEELKGREAYWLKVFESDLPVLDLPLDYPRPPVRAFEGKTIPFRLEAEQVEALELLAKEEGGTHRLEDRD